MLKGLKDAFLFAKIILIYFFFFLSYSMNLARAGLTPPL